MTPEFENGYIAALEEVMHEMILETRTPRKWLIYIKEKLDRMKSCKAMRCSLDE